MKNFTIKQVETTFKSKYPQGEMILDTEFYKGTTKRCYVKFNQNGKQYKYSFNSPLDLMRSLNLATEEEILNYKDKKYCKCGSKEIININENECSKCTKKENSFLFLLN